MMLRKKYDIENLGHTVRLLRINRKISQFALASRLGVSQTNMSNLEHGRVMFSLKLVIRLSEIFDLSVEELLTGNINETQAEEASYSLSELKMLLELLHKDGKS